MFVSFVVLLMLVVHRFPAESPVEDCVSLLMDPLLKCQPPMVDCEGLLTIVFYQSLQVFAVLRANSWARVVPNFS